MERLSFLRVLGYRRFRPRYSRCASNPLPIHFRFPSTSFSTERRERPTGVFSALLDGHRLPAGRLSGNRGDRVISAPPTTLDSTTRRFPEVGEIIWGVEAYVIAFFVVEEVPGDG
ncbi:hypothetical protein C8R44DRAFT_746874 [Mycena epipterygia]|nr:hypothetical protein C8R44DRAFT_746874 [Mycena epipterygia]